jgi:hypothetical protein
MRPLALTAVLAFAAAVAGVASSATVITDPQNRSVTPSMVALPVHAVGRMRVQPLAGPMPPGANAYVHQWPGVYFEAAFSGDRVVLAFADAANEYRLLVDRQAPVVIAQPGDAQVRIEGLGPGLHRLRLEKVTESTGARGAFRGFYIPAGEQADVAPPRARQIEFVGDSLMSGFGARSGKVQCTGDEARLTGDTQQAYAALSAKRLDADYQINAISGRGLIRNFGGHAPDGAMLQVYPYAFFDRSQPYSDPDWRPQIVVVRLIADFVSPLQPGERWTDFGQVANDYVSGYAALIASLHARDPAAMILAQWPDARQLGDPAHAEAFEAMRQAIAAAAAQAGAPLAFFPLDVDQSQVEGCAHHPGLETHARMAAALTDYLSAHPEYWQGR